MKRPNLPDAFWDSIEYTHQPAGPEDPTYRVSMTFDNTLLTPTQLTQFIKWNEYRAKKCNGHVLNRLDTFTIIGPVTDDDPNTIAAVCVVFDPATYEASFHVLGGAPQTPEFRERMTELARDAIAYRRDPTAFSEADRQRLETTVFDNEVYDAMDRHHHKD